MLCNRELKFGLLGGMLRPGEELATGHYVRRSPLGVRRGLDPAKDQSYFLALVRGDDLRRCRFPLGGMEKSAVRAFALSRGIPFRRRESMDLCFDLAGGGAGAGPGPLLAPDGRVLGEHPGIEGFTVGQRRGFGALGRRLYVLSVDPGANSVTVGMERDLLSDGCTAVEGSWLAPSGPPPAGSCLVQTRHRRRPVPAWFEPDGNGTSFTVRFAERESAVARGQVCAVYLDDELIGGGVVSSTFTLREDRE